MEKIAKIIRSFENTGYYGYMFLVEYEGKEFGSFDENPDVRSVKSEFRKLLLKNGISVFKGIQQAGRTDKDVNAAGNILYINSRCLIEFSELKYREADGLKIRDVKKTVPFLEFPEMIRKRHYVYKYPENMVRNKQEKIQDICKEVSGKRDFKEFTSKKGEKLKNHIREIKVEYKDGELYFEGDGFLPQQVRIMSGYILNGKKKPLEGVYLTLEKVELTDEMEKLILRKVSVLPDELRDGEEQELYETFKDMERIEKNHYFYVFYVNPEDKGKIIGKKGKNIKKLKKIFGDILIKELKK